MPSEPVPLLPLMGRLLTFRASREELLGVDYRHLALGLLCTWVVGMGRSWDDAKASLAQHLGVGSLVYVFVLASILWATIAPLAPRKISYQQVLTFITLVSPPAILYAIPVEMFVASDTARNCNAILLCVVATWRVALLVRYLSMGVGLLIDEIIVATLFPLATIITPIAFFGLMNEIMSAMSGLRGEEKVSEPANAILYMIGSVAGLSWLPLAVANSILIGRRRNERKLEAKWKDHSQTRDQTLTGDPGDTSARNE